MHSIDRDIRVIRHIRNYCDEVKTAHEDFATSKDKFMSSSTYRNAITMPILQIGELVNHLSEGFIKTHKQIPWNEMRGIRNLFAHQYQWTISLRCSLSASNAYDMPIKTVRRRKK